MCLFSFVFVFAFVIVFVSAFVFISSGDIPCHLPPVWPAQAFRRVADIAER